MTRDEALERVGRPTEADIGAIVWPIWRAFLDSEHTLQTLAKNACMTPRQIERAFLQPGRVKISTWGRIAYGLGGYARPRMYELGDWSLILDRVLPRQVGG